MNRDNQSCGWHRYVHISVIVGEWVLDLSEPYGRTVLEELFYLANTKAGCDILHLTHNDKVLHFDRSTELDAGSFNLEDYYVNCKMAAKEVIGRNIELASGWLEKLLRQFEFEMNAQQRRQTLKKVQEHWNAKSSEDRADELHEVFLFEVFHALFVLNDFDESDSMELDEFLSVMTSLGRPNFDEDRAVRLMSEYDRDDSGEIDANEFAMIMVNEVIHFEFFYKKIRGFLCDLLFSFQNFIQIVH
jgi:hypothetical protein